MGQAKQRGSVEERIRQARERDRAETEVQEREERIGNTLRSILHGGRFGFGGPYDDRAALAMAAKAHGLEITVVPEPPRFAGATFTT